MISCSFWVVTFLANVPLPVVNGKGMLRFLERNGYVLKRCNGSHFHYKRSDGKGYLITVPVHGKDEIKADTLDSIIYYIAINEGMTIDEVRRAISEM